MMMMTYVVVKILKHEPEPADLTDFICPSVGRRSLQ